MSEFKRGSSISKVNILPILRDISLTVRWAASST